MVTSFNFLDDAFAALIDNNLVIQLLDVHGEPRFSMLSTIDDYARERLVDTDEADPVHYQHAQYFIKFVSNVEPRVRSSERVRWRQVMHQEFGNVRRNVGMDLQPTGKCIDIGQQIIINLGSFWHFCGYIAEGRQWCSRMLALCAELKPLSSTGLGCCAFLEYLPGRKMTAYSRTQTVDESLQLCRVLDDKHLLAFALLVRGIVASASRDLVTAASALLQKLLSFIDNE